MGPDRIKIILGAVVVVAGLAGFYYFGNQPLVLRVAIVLAGIAAGVAIAWTSREGRQLQAFARESIEETKKVAWPTRKESFQTTAVVFGFVVAMAVFLWVVDKTLEWSMYDRILGWR